MNMTKKEFAIFASAMRTYYPKESLLPNEQAMRLWFNQLSDIPYNVAEVALEKWVSSNRWSPSIADIRELAAGLTTGDSKDWGDAWQEVLAAISKFGSYREDEALESLDDVTRRTVRQLGFRNICMSEEIQVDRANFRDIYNILMKRELQKIQLPPKLKAIIDNSGLLLEGGSEND